MCLQVSFSMTCVMEILLLLCFFQTVISVHIAELDAVSDMRSSYLRQRRQNGAAGPVAPKSVSSNQGGGVTVDECPTSNTESRDDRRLKRGNLFAKQQQSAPSNERQTPPAKNRQRQSSTEREVPNQFVLEEIDWKLNCGQEQVFRRYMKKYRKKYQGREFARRQCIYHRNMQRIKELNEKAKKSDEAHRRGGRNEGEGGGNKRTSNELNQRQDSGQQPNQGKSNQQSRGKEPNQQQNNQRPANQQSTNQQSTNQQSTNQQSPNQQSANQESVNQQSIDQEVDLDEAADTETAQFGENPFTDLTVNEFTTHYTGALPEPNVQHLTFSNQDLTNNPQLAQNLQNQPSKFDLRKHGVILTNIRNQGSCGSCYAFATADQVSAQHALERKEIRKTLSVQHIVDCISNGGGCRGARVGLVMQRLTNESKGVPLEQCYRYQQTNGTCKKGASCCMYRKIKWFQVLDVSGPREKEIIAGLLRWGPLTTVVGVSDVWQFYNGSGVIMASQCQTGVQNHAVLITGYNFEGPVPYYIIRNSWSEDWGNKGYLRLEAGKNACSVAKIIMSACAHDCDKAKNARDRLGLPPPLFGS